MTVRPIPTDRAEWFDVRNADTTPDWHDHEPSVAMAELVDGYYMLGPADSKHVGVACEGTRVTIGPFALTDLADQYRDCELPSGGEGIALVLDGNVAAWWPVERVAHYGEGWDVAWPAVPGFDPPIGYEAAVAGYCRPLAE